MFQQGGLHNGLAGSWWQCRVSVVEVVAELIIHLSSVGNSQQKSDGFDIRKSGKAMTKGSG